MSGSVTSTEQISFDSPMPGTYTVFVHGFETEGPAATYTLFSWVLGTANGSPGNLVITAPPNARSQEIGTVNVSWSGLLPGTKYLGIVTHHSTRKPRDYFDEFLGHTGRYVMPRQAVLPLFL